MDRSPGNTELKTSVTLGGRRLLIFRGRSTPSICWCPQQHTEPQHLLQPLPPHTVRHLGLGDVEWIVHLDSPTP